MAAFAGALAAAIPVIDKIVKAIFPDNKPKKKKDASDAVASEKSSSAAALKSLGEELSLVAKVLESCLPAEDGIVIMKAVLDAKKREALSPTDKLMIETAWDLVTENIRQIKDRQTKTAVNGLSDVFTRVTFLEVINAETKGTDRYLRAWATDELRDEVSDLHKSLNKVNKVAAQVIAGLATGLAKASSTQNKPQAANPEKPEKED